MNHTCSCGGRMQSLHENSFYFRMRCDKCGKTNKQRKRQKEVSMTYIPTPTIGARMWNRVEYKGRIGEVIKELSPHLIKVDFYMPETTEIIAVNAVKFLADDKEFSTSTDLAKRLKQIQKKYNQKVGG